MSCAKNFCAWRAYVGISDIHRCWHTMQMTRTNMFRNEYVVCQTQVFSIEKLHLFLLPLKRYLRSKVRRYIFIFHSRLLRFVTSILRCISRSMSYVFQHVQGHLRKSVSLLFTWITHVTSRFISSSVCSVIIYNNFL